MGCFSSKQNTYKTRCLNCGRRIDESALINNICTNCLKIHEQEIIRRLAALRDDKTTSNQIVSVARPPAQIGAFTRAQLDADVPRRSIVTSQPRYIALPKKTTSIRGKRSIHSPANGTITKPLFGVYKCPECRYTWNSRRSWRGMYQKCQKCGKQVYPSSQRELRKSDMTNTDNPHPEHLCEKCINLGYYCGNYRRLTTNRRRK